MKITNPQRTYGFELTQKQFERLLKKDKKALDKGTTRSRTGFEVDLCPTLVDTLLAIDGVHRVAYDPMEGSTVFVDIWEPFDPVVETVKQAIAIYLR